MVNCTGWGPARQVNPVLPNSQAVVGQDDHNLAIARQFDVFAQFQRGFVRNGTDNLTVEVNGKKSIIPLPVQAQGFGWAQFDDLLVHGLVFRLVKISKIGQVCYL